jgi:hypothetical protein
MAGLVALLPPFPVDVIDRCTDSSLLGKDVKSIASRERPRLRHETSHRAKCTVCGEFDVAHTKDDVPYEIHRRGKRHQDAVRANGGRDIR